MAWAEGGTEKVALDVATGGGHTALALAPLYRRVLETGEPVLDAELTAEIPERPGAPATWIGGHKTWDARGR